jgi:hypothetical protein
MCSSCGPWYPRACGSGPHISTKSQRRKAPNSLRYPRLATSRRLIVRRIPVMVFPPRYHPKIRSGSIMASDRRNLAFQTGSLIENTPRCHYFNLYTVTKVRWSVHSHVLGPTEMTGCSDKSSLVSALACPRAYRNDWHSDKSSLIKAWPGCKDNFVV